jgi:hypothetical protein
VNDPSVRHDRWEVWPTIDQSRDPYTRLGFVPRPTSTNVESEASATAVARRFTEKRGGLASDGLVT